MSDSLVDFYDDVQGDLPIDQRISVERSSMESINDVELKDVHQHNDIVLTVNTSPVVSYPTQGNSLVQSNVRVVKEDPLRRTFNLLAGQELVGDLEQDPLRRTFNLLAGQELVGDLEQDPIVSTKFFTYERKETIRACLIGTGFAFCIVIIMMIIVAIIMAIIIGAVRPWRR
jgi:hypothetical protein